MEQQTTQKIVNTPANLDDFAILKLIQTIYLAKNTQEITQAEKALNQLILNHKFIEKLFFFLENSQQLSITIEKPQQFKICIATIIKKFSYQFAKQEQTNKQLFIQKIFSLLVSTLNSKAKQSLGIGLQYVLNLDIQCLYRPSIIEKISEIMHSESQACILEGSIIIATSCLNSLIEVEDQYIFIEKILNSLINISINILQILKSQALQNLVFDENKKLFKLASKIFELIELSLERFLEEEDLLGHKIDQLRIHQGLNLVFFSYLSCFTSKKSILSTVPHISSQINQIKQIIVQTIYILFRTKSMQQNLFNLFLLTILLESERQIYEEQEFLILSRVMQTLQNHLENKFFMNTFSDHKMQLLIALLAYCVSKPEQYDMIQDEPQKFVDIAEDFTEAFKSSVNIKVRAASFLRVYVQKFDEAPKSILQIVVIIITANLEIGDQESITVELFNSLKQQFSEMGFFKLSSGPHFQVCFNVLSLLSPYIKKRQDLNKVVYAILVTHFDKFLLIDQPIVVLRLIRMIGYYPTAIYYDLIKSKISLGQVYALEGFKTLQRVLKANKYPQIYEVLSQIFFQLGNSLKMNDNIFQFITINHYERILKVNSGLYNNFLIKIRDYFIQNLQKNQSFTLKCFEYIHCMLKKENDSLCRRRIQEIFYSMDEFYNKVVAFYTSKLNSVSDPDYEQNKKKLKTLSYYQDRIICIYSNMVNKQPNITDRMIIFSANKLKTLNEHNKNEEIFTLYNNLFLKLDPGFDKISLYYQGFMQHIRNMFRGFLGNQSSQSSRSYAENLQILPNLSYLVSQLFACYKELTLGKDDLLWMLSVLNRVTKNVKQYILLIIVSFAYNDPVGLKRILKSQNLYEQTLKYLLTTEYDQSFIRKIFILAMTKILQIEQKYIIDIVRECIKYLNEQFYKNQIVQKKKEQVDPKMRRLLADLQYTDQEEMIQEKQKKQSMCSVPNFKHPWSVYSEYEHFGIKLWQNTQIINQLTEQDRNQLREISKMDWQNKKVRKIVYVKYPLVRPPQSGNIFRRQN